MYKDWTTEEINLLTKLSGTMSYNKMRKLHFPERTPYSLSAKSKNLGLISKFRREKYSHDENLWSRLTPETAYYAGCLATDGYLHASRYTFSWRVAPQDKGMLESFREFARIEAPIRFFSYERKGGGSRKESYSLEVSGCRQWYEDLKSIWSITRQKTFTLSAPNISMQNLIWPYIIGAIDGDGHIGVLGKHRNFRLEITSASHQWLEWIDARISQRFPKEKYQRKHVFENIGSPKGKSYYFLRYNGYRAADIFSFLSEFQIPKLHRKWHKPEVIARVQEYQQKRPAFSLTTQSTDCALSGQISSHSRIGV